METGPLRNYKSRFVTISLPLMPIKKIKLSVKEILKNAERKCNLYTLLLLLVNILLTI